MSSLKDNVLMELEDSEHAVLEYVRDKYFESEMSHELKNHLSEWIMRTQEIIKMIKYLK